MQKLQFSIIIDAPKDKVWHAILNDKSYRMWTKAFNEGGYYVGNWAKGTKMLFLGPDPETGKEMGMVSRIAENRPLEFLSIEHQGLVVDGQEDTTSEAAKKWASTYENYKLSENDGKTELTIEMDCSDEYVEQFKKMWPNALELLKMIAEQE